MTRATTSATRWRRIWRLVGPPAGHAIDAPALGQFVALSLKQGQAAAERAFPAVTEHLATGCPRCSAEAHEMRERLS